MNNKKLTIGAAALTAVIVTTGFAASSFAYQGDPSVEGPNCTEERREAITNAFESGDYNAWVEARGDIGKKRLKDVINEGNFSKFAEMRELRLAGDTEGADALRAELGLGQGSQNHGSRKGQGQGQNGSRRMQNSGARGQNAGGNFVDTNGDGTCDNIQ